MSETLPALFARSVARWGDRDLIVTPASRLGYAEADAASLRLARALVGAGIGKGSRVGLQFPNGPEWVTAFLAVVRVGATAVPISTFHQPPEMAWALAHSDVQLHLCRRTMFGRDFGRVLEEAVPGLAGARAGAYQVPAVPFLRSVLFWGGAPPWGWSADTEVERLAEGVDPELISAREEGVAPSDVALQLYSSGSTARPKAALHTHGGLVRRLDVLRPFRNHVDGDRVYTPMPFFWVGGLMVGLLDALAVGHTCLVAEGVDPEATLEFLSRERVTVFSAWPAMLVALSRAYATGKYDLSSVRAGNLVEALPPQARPKDPLLRVNALGMTETCGPHTWGNPLVDLPEERRGSFGTSTADTEHRIVDPETGAVLGSGESGEICVRGPNVMLGLHKVERADVFDRDGWYHTGDHGYFDAGGHLFFEGRKDEMIKTAGANVSAREVETALMAFDDVALAAVVGIPHPTRGKLIAAAVVPEKGAAPAARELWERLRAVVSAFTVPRRIWVCTAGEMPMTASGKVDKKALERVMEDAGEVVAPDEP